MLPSPPWCPSRMNSPIEGPRPRPRWRGLQTPGSTIDGGLGAEAPHRGGQTGKQLSAPNGSLDKQDGGCWGSFRSVPAPQQGPQGQGTSGLAGRGQNCGLKTHRTGLCPPLLEFFGGQFRWPRWGVGEGVGDECRGGPLPASRGNADSALPADRGLEGPLKTLSASGRLETSICCWTVLTAAASPPPCLLHQTLHPWGLPWLPPPPCPG